jgi:hypothetical protein
MIAGLCKYTDLTDGTLNLADVADMNDILDVTEENQARLYEAMKVKQRG